MSFKENVLNIDFEIKKGKVLSYKDIAKMSGNINASRVVGNIMAKNQDKNIPCHRVVRSDGSVGWYNGIRNNKKGSESKMELLKSEGVKIEKGRVVFEKHEKGFKK